MAKNKPTPLKDEPVMSLDDISTKLDNLAASIGALQKEQLLIITIILSSTNFTTPLRHHIKSCCRIISRKFFSALQQPLSEWTAKQSCRTLTTE